MNVKQNILETIGDTPMIKLNKIAESIPCPVYAKVDYFNPGHSIKDRMALKMVEVAEQDGRLKPGGTIIECTSGNTGMGIALAACVKGYKCIFTTSDKQAKAKLDILRAMGGEVIVCPTNVEPDDPRSYYSVARKLSEEIPNSFWANQYDNLSNTLAHYETTGPEIWNQTDGKITHLITGVGTGGTICGTGKYLKEKNKDIKIWGVDPYGSVFKKYHETGEFDQKEIYPYIMEGIGEDILPKNVDFSVIDHFEKVTDKEGALVTRRLAKEEGLLLGYSSGGAMAGLIQLKDQLKPTDLVVIIFHDHGSRYISKVFNDDWMRDRGFLDDDMTIKDIIGKKTAKEKMLTLASTDTVNKAFELMKERDISQIPIVSNEELIGSITETKLLSHMLDNPEQASQDTLEKIMDEPFPLVEESMPIKNLRMYMNKKIPAVISKNKAGIMHIITNYDIIQVVE